MISKINTINPNEIIDMCFAYIDKNKDKNEFFHSKRLLYFRHYITMAWYQTIEILDTDGFYRFDCCELNIISDILFRLNQAIIDLVHCINHKDTIKYGDSLVITYTELVKSIILELCTLIVNYDSISNRLFDVFKND